MKSTGEEAVSVAQGMALQPGDMLFPSYQGGPEGDERYNVSWGFVEVLPDRVTILATDALKPEEIDVQRAQQQLDRGHKEWDEAGDSEEAYSEALHVIAEAEAKLASAGEQKR